MGGIQEIMRHLGVGILQKNPNNSVYILTEHDDYKLKQYSFENNFHVYYYNWKNILLLLFKKKIDIICIFEPYRQYVQSALLFKIFNRKIKTNLVFCGTRTEVSDWPFKKLSFFVSRLFDGLIAISEYAKQAVFKGKYLQKIKIIYCPIIFDNYKKSSFVRYNIITIGRICPRKNYHDLIKMFSIVHQSISNIHLDIIGGYENIHINYYKEILQLIDDLGLNNYITFHGDISEEKKIQLLSESRIYVTTSKHEMFGITTAEAMASGLPIIAYKNTATEEVVLSADGILVENGRYDLMAQQITNLIDDGNKINQLSIKGRDAAKLYDLKYFLDGYLSLFKKQYNSKRTKKFSFPLADRLKKALHNIENQKLLRKNFKIIRTLGEGKDGKIYLCKNFKGKKKVVKVLSSFGKQYLPITQEFVKEQITSKHLYSLEIISDSLIVYPYEKLYPIKTDSKNYLNILKQICDLEIDLIKHGLCFWDFGFINHCNYMINDNGLIKIIDYGGNSFLLINNDRKITIPNIRKNLVYAKNNFLQLQFLYHIYYYGLGRRTKELLPSLSQYSSDQEIKNYFKKYLNELEGTIYHKIVKKISQLNLLTVDGWKYLNKIIDDEINANKNKYHLQESADINKINFLKYMVEVRGYQNYNITHHKITPITLNDNSLWDSEKKIAIVKKSLRRITEQDNIDSLLDLGSNLGMYVFFGKLKYHIKKCTGIDYNQKYIDGCNKIANYLNIKGCFFKTKKFSELNKKYDCVIAMGIIHHLYHRTEEFGSLENIIKLFSKIVNKHLVIEFPTEKDIKAKKWTNIPSRIKSEEYSQKKFLHYSKKYFTRIIKIGNVCKTRPTFLLSK